VRASDRIAAATLWWALSNTNRGVSTNSPSSRDISRFLFSHDPLEKRYAGRMEQAMAASRGIAWLSLTAAIVALMAAVCAIFVRVIH
jgi:hypothetical protein